MELGALGEFIVFLGVQSSNTTRKTIQNHLNDVGQIQSLIGLQQVQTRIQRNSCYIYPLLDRAHKQRISTTHRCWISSDHMNGVNGKLHKKKHQKTIGCAFDRGWFWCKRVLVLAHITPLPPKESH